MAVLVYPLFPNRLNRLHLAIVCLPIVLLAMPVLSELITGYFRNAEGGLIRLKAYGLALQLLPDYWLFGVGENSQYGRTYQDLFAYYSGCVKTPKPFAAEVNFQCSVILPLLAVEGAESR